MADASMSPGARRDVESYVGSGAAAADIARWLGLAAAPTFALMALWTALFGGQPDMACMAQGSWSMSGMAVMYLLMSAFHSAPWLKLLLSAPGRWRWPFPRAVLAGVGSRSAASRKISDSMDGPSRCLG
jgi:hypothetical protein